MKRKVKEMPGVIIVTGGAEGIGAEICQGLAADGLKVVVVDYAKDAAEKMAVDIRRQSEKPLQFKESHPMDHDSNSSGHTKIQGATLKFQITAWRERETGEWSVGVMARWSAVRRYSNTPAGQLFYTSPFSWA